MKEKLSERTHGVLVINEQVKVLFRYQDKVESGELAVIKQSNKPEAELKRFAKFERSTAQTEVLGKVLYMICDVEALEQTELPSGSCFCGTDGGGKTALFSVD